jgi:lysophospholipase L1-like esterase
MTSGKFTPQTTLFFLTIVVLLAIGYGTIYKLTNKGDNLVKKSDAIPPPILQKVIQGNRTIIMLGDSITQGEKNHFSYHSYVVLVNNYLKRLYPNQKITVVNAGIGGNRSADLANRFVKDAIETKPDLITINIGVNDVWHYFLAKNNPNLSGIPVANYRQNLIKMIKQAQAAKIQVILMSPTIIQEDLNSEENQKLVPYVAAMRQVAKEYNCLFVDLNTAFRDTIATYQKYAGKEYTLLTNDGVHTNDLGNQVIAHTFLRSLGVLESDMDQD